MDEQMVSGSNDYDCVAQVRESERREREDKRETDWASNWVFYWPSQPVQLYQGETDWDSLKTLQLKSQNSTVLKSCSDRETTTRPYITSQSPGQQPEQGKLTAWHPPGISPVWGRCTGTHPPTVHWSSPGRSLGHTSRNMNTWCVPYTLGSNCLATTN